MTTVGAIAFKGLFDAPVVHIDGTLELHSGLRRERWVVDGRGAMKLCLQHKWESNESATRRGSLLIETGLA